MLVSGNMIMNTKKKRFVSITQTSSATQNRYYLSLLDFHACEMIGEVENDLGIHIGWPSGTGHQICFLVIVITRSRKLFRDPAAAGPFRCCFADIDYYFDSRTQMNQFICLTAQNSEKGKPTGLPFSLFWVSKVSRVELFRD